MTNDEKRAVELAEQICEHYTGASDDGTCEETEKLILEAIKQKEIEVKREVLERVEPLVQAMNKITCVKAWNYAPSQIVDSKAYADAWLECVGIACLALDEWRKTTADHKKIRDGK